MKEVIITVTDDYDVPDLSNIEPEEWEVMVQSLVDLTSLRPNADDISHKSQLSKQLQEVGKKKIAELTNELLTRTRTIDELTHQIRTMEEDHKKTLLERTSELNKRMTNEIANEIRVNYEEEKKKLMQKHKDELNETIADFKKANERLNKKYEEDKQTELDDIIKRHQKQLHTYQEEINDYEKQIQINKEKVDSIKQEAESLKQLYEATTKQANEAAIVAYETAKHQAVEAAKQQTILECERAASDRIRAVELAYEKKISDYDNRLDARVQFVESSCNKRVDALEQTISILQETNAKLNGHIVDLNGHIVDQKDAIKDNIATLSTSVLEMSKPLLKFYNGSNEEKGTSGEEFIEQLLLSDRYTGATISDVSGVAASGDRYFKYGQLRCLISFFAPEG